ncbi:MAG TPA: FHA domain-containing protein [Pyrinomonadaceae bacterium]|jgi:pSer/pThr/pTyr-binding forkhead associated (FHA) protein|nr:FHA domain-containing protein [Pyrinomonadaceae bacterium]
MKITLLEEHAGQPYPERSFTSEIVKIGRDPLECHVVFDQSDWPMVSRRHAEFRHREGRCLLVDTGSKFGTYVDGKRVGDPSEVRVGDRVQFGAGGPLMRILAIEEATESTQVSEDSFRARSTIIDVPGSDEDQTR